MAYSGTPTTYGEQQIAAALATSKPLTVVAIAVGDGGGSAVSPSEGQTKLTNEVWRGAISSWGVDPADTRRIVVHVTIPATAGPFVVREAGVYDAAGGLICVTALAATEVVGPGTSNQATSIDLIIAMPIASAGAITVSPTQGERFTIERLYRPPFISINSATTKVPPAAPALGDLYIVPQSATGAWATAAVGTIAEWNGTYWAFLMPPLKMVAGIMDASDDAAAEFLKWNGTVWEVLGTPGCIFTVVDTAGASTPDEFVGTATPGLVALVPNMVFQFRQGTAANASTSPQANITNSSGTALGDKPFSKADGSKLAAGDLPANVEFLAMWDGAQMRVFGQRPSDLIAYVAANLLITTAITKVIGTDFPTLAAAMAWVSQYRITTTGSVNFVLPAGQTTLTANLTLSHPQGSRISITGAPMVGANPTAASFQVTGPSAAQRAADKAANLAMCRARYGSEILLAGGVTIYIVGKFGAVTNLLFTGDGTTTANGGDVISFPDGQATFIGCVVNGGAGRGFVTGGAGSLTTSGTFAFGNGSNGFSAEEGGKIILTNGPGSFGNGGHGFLASGGACLLVDQTVPSSLTAKGNGGSGIQATLGASIPTIGPAAVLSSNGIYGAGASLNGTACADGATAASNGSTAFAASSGGTLSAVNTSGGLNGGYGYSSSGVGLVIASGGTATGASGSLSPAANTVGNGNAYIYQ